MNRSPNVTRKTLPLCKTILELPLFTKETAMDNETDPSDSSDSESEDEMVREVKPRKVIKKKKKKKMKKRQKVSNQKSKELEEEAIEQTNAVSVLDLTSVCNLRAHSWHRTMVSTPYR